MKPVFAILILLAAATLASAHPHVFVDATIKAQFDKQGFSGIQNHWVYDKMYSAAMFASADEDANGKLSAKETDWLKNNILGSIEGSNYYNYVQTGTKFLKADGIKDFKAAMVNGKLTLDFTVAFSEPAKSDYTMLVIVLNDISNYIQMTCDMSKADVVAPDEMDVEFFDDSLKGLTLMKAFRSDVRGLYLRYKK